VWLWTAVVGVVGLGSIAWTARFNVLGTGTAATYPNLTFPVAAKHTFELSVEYLRQMVGFFGWLDVRAPYNLAELWFVPVLALLVAAAAAGKLRDVAALVVLAGSVILIPVLAQGRQASSLGYIWQGRYLLAVAAGLPLLAAAILAKRKPRRAWLRRTVPWLPLAVTASTLALGFLMFYATLRRYAVGTSGPLLLPLQPTWTPPGTVAGVVLLYLVGVALAALVVLKSWAPYPAEASEGSGGGSPVPELAPLPVHAPAAANGTANGHVNGTANGTANAAANGAANGTTNGNGKKHPVNGSGTAVAPSSSEDRDAAVASTS
jgi:hypothetical protein